MTTEADRRVEHACRKIQDRLDGLKPYVVEFNLLRVALLGIESQRPAFEDQPRSKSERAFAAIYLAPGSTTQELSTDSGIALASLYPVLRTLSEQGLAHSISRRWYPGPRDPEYTNILDVA